jgi:urea carboxylase
VAVSEGQRVSKGDVLLVIESMKMEFSVLAPASGEVHKLLCTQGAPIAAGQNVVVLVDDTPANTA